MTQMDRIPVSSYPGSIVMTQGYGPFVSFCIGVEEIVVGVFLYVQLLYSIV